MRNRFPALVLGALALLGSSAAHADAKVTVTAKDDTYVKRNNKGPYGSEPHLLVKNVGKKDNTRKSLVRFVNVNAVDPYKVELAFDVSYWEGGPSAAAFNVFGIDMEAGYAAGNDCWGLLFGVHDVKYKSDPITFLNDSSDGVINGSPCIYGGAPLGRIAFTSSDVGRTVTFSSAALEQYVRHASSFWGVAVFLLTQTDDRSQVLGFASIEHPTLQPARLSWWEGGAADLVDENPENVQNGTRHVEGSLRIPFGDGRFITLPGANVDVTLQDGRITAIHGTVGYPDLPVDEFFDRAGIDPLQVGTPSLRIGYDTPAHFDFPDLDLTFPLPLDPWRKYYYLVADTGFTLQVLDIATFTPPLGTVVVFVIDPTTETIFFLSGLKERTHGGTEAMSFRSPSGMLVTPKQFAVGFSGDNRLEFRPIATSGMEEYLAGFWGDVYLSAAVELQPSASSDGSVEVGAYLAGEMLVNYDEARFADTNPTNALRDIGINGIGTVEVDFHNVVELSIPFAEGTTTVTRASNGAPRIAFNGKLLSIQEALDQMPALANAAGRFPQELQQVLPVGFGTGARVAGYVDPNQPAESFVRLEGTMVPAFPLPNGVQLEGGLTFGPTLVGFSGKLKYPIGTLSMSGELDGDTLRLETEQKIRGSQGDWSINFYVHPKVALSPHSFGGALEAEFDACIVYWDPKWNDPDNTSKYCVPRQKVAFKDFNVSTGEIRVCTPRIATGIPGVPALDRYCRNLF